MFYKLHQHETPNRCFFSEAMGATNRENSFECRNYRKNKICKMPRFLFFRRLSDSKFLLKFYYENCYFDFSGKFCEI